MTDGRRAASGDLPAVAVPGGWDAMFDGPARDALERALPAFVRSQRWFGAKARTVAAVRVADHGRLTATAFLVLLEVEYAEGGRDLYSVPLAVAPGMSVPTAAVARLTGPAGEAILSDALGDDAACVALLDVIGGGREIVTRGGHVRGVPTAAFAGLRGEPSTPLAVTRGPATSSNSLVFFGQRLLLKLFRRLEAGVNPDFEVGRFLTETGRFARTPPVAGALEYHPADGSGPFTLGILQAVVPNGGDGWADALAALADYYAGAGDDIGRYADAAAMLGRRTAEMHLALASDTTDPDFVPEPLTAADADALTRETLVQGRAALAALAANVGRLPPDAGDVARRLLAIGPAALDRIAAAPAVALEAMKTRIHGDYHLGQVLRADEDFVIIDFEGEPTRPVAERRAKFSPARDVAGMHRSYHYAAYAGLFATGDDRQRPRAERWYRQASAAFQRAYRDTAGDAAFVPRAAGGFEALVDRFALAKSLYELNYELNNRPDWVRIPLGGVLALLGGPEGKT